MQLLLRHYMHPKTNLHRLRNWNILSNWTAQVWCAITVPVDLLNLCPSVSITCSSLRCVGVVDDPVLLSARTLEEAVVAGSEHAVSAAELDVGVLLPA